MDVNRQIDQWNTIQNQEMDTTNTMQHSIKVTFQLIWGTEGLSNK